MVVGRTLVVKLINQVVNRLLLFGRAIHQEVDMFELKIVRHGPEIFRRMNFRPRVAVQRGEIFFVDALGNQRTCLDSVSRIPRITRLESTAAHCITRRKDRASLA